jgi:hypothetical protein
MRPKYFMTLKDCCFEDPEVAHVAVRKLAIS